MVDGRGAPQRWSVWVVVPGMSTCTKLLSGMYRIPERTPLGLPIIDTFIATSYTDAWDALDSFYAVAATVDAVYGLWSLYQPKAHPVRIPIMMKRQPALTAAIHSVYSS